MIEFVPHQIKTDKMQYMKVNQVVSQRPIFSFKTSISGWTQQLHKGGVWQIHTKLLNS